MGKQVKKEKVPVMTDKREVGESFQEDIKEREMERKTLDRRRRKRRRSAGRYESDGRQDVEER